MYSTDVFIEYCSSASLSDRQCTIKRIKIWFITMFPIEIPGGIVGINNMYGVVTVYNRASSSTLGQKNRKIGNISLENRNKIGIYE